MFLIGAALASLAVLLGIMTTLVFTVTEDADLLSDIRVEQWFEMARTFGFLSVGFFFVAYRALAPGARAAPRPRPRRSEAPPTEPSEA